MENPLNRWCDASRHSLTGSGRLHQVLGVAFGIAVLVGNTIGVGILRTPGDVATQLPSTGLFLTAWLLGGLYAILGAMSLAEPGAMIRRSGAQYPIVYRALGPYPGFIVGWTDWLSTAASAALMAFVFAEYAAPWIPDFAGEERVIATGVVLMFGMLQWHGVRTGDAAQQLLSAFKALAFTALGVAALVLAVPDRAVSTPAILPAGAALFAAFIIALQSVIYTYDGWTGPLYFGDETVAAGRSMPRAMIGGLLVVLTIYLLLNLAMVRVVGVERMAGDPFVAATMASTLFGPNGDPVLRLLVLGSILGGINALLMMVSRIPLAMGEDRLLPVRMTAVNAGGTPIASHWISIGIAIGFILSGTFNTVLAIAAFFFVANYTLSFTSVFVLRRTEPDAPRPWRVPGFPFTTGIALLGSIAFLGGAIVTDWSNSLRSLILLGLSWPVYWMVVRVRNRA
mgnify:CR=1 FL=1